MCSQCNKESPNALGQSTSCWMLCKERIRACCCGRKRGRERKRNTSEHEGDMQSRLTASLHADASACAGERRSGEVTLLSPSCWAGEVRTEFPVLRDSLGSSLVEQDPIPRRGSAAPCLGTTMPVLYLASFLFKFCSYSYWHRLRERKPCWRCSRLKQM